jgi:hypothetical protein
MAAIHDKAREDRWLQRGGRRLHTRITAKASEALDELAKAFDCNHRDVIEGLLLGTIDPKCAKAQSARLKLLQFASRERLSATEMACLEPTL